MPRLFTKTTTVSSIPIEIGCEAESESGQYRVYTFVDGISQGEALTATDATLESALATAEQRARHTAQQAGLGRLDSESEGVKLLKKLGYVERQIP